MNFDRLRLVAELAGVGARQEAMLVTTIPELPGSFMRFASTALAESDLQVTEFKYRCGLQPHCCQQQSWGTLSMLLTLCCCSHLADCGCLVLGKQDDACSLQGEGSLWSAAAVRAWLTLRYMPGVACMPRAP